MKRKTKIILWLLVLAILLPVTGALVWTWRFKTYTPKEAIMDIKAGIAARNDPKPVERFLEIRYGPLTESTNRQKAFLDFFNEGHIEGMHIMVKHMKPDQRQSNITAMAQWVSNFRQGLTPDEKLELKEFIKSDLGRMTLQRASAKYLQQDVRYRAATAPVIEQLMTTLSEVQKP